MKKRITINENRLNKIVNESIKKFLFENESMGEMTLEDFFRLQGEYFDAYPKTPKEKEELKKDFIYFKKKYKWFMSKHPEYFEEGGCFEDCNDEYSFIEGQINNYLGEEIPEDDEFDELYFHKYFS